MTVVDALDHPVETETVDPAGIVAVLLCARLSVSVKVPACVLATFNPLNSCGDAKLKLAEVAEDVEK